MRERRERVHGPYKQGRRWRVIIVGAGGEDQRELLTFATEEEARQAVTLAQNKTASRTVSAAVAAYTEAQAKRVDEGELRASTVERDGYHLRSILKLRERGGIDLRQLTPAYAVRLYDERVGAVDTHRNGLAVVKAFGAWCVMRGWLRANPFSGIKGRGRRKRGKPQFRIAEAQTFALKCLDLAPHDAGAVLSLAYLILGTRAGEIVHRQVRDLDDGGRLLWIPDSKTEAGRRRLEVPDVLVPHLVRIASGRPASARLFAHTATRKRATDWAREQVTRLCRLAGVPRITPQGLRGTNSTLATEAGAASHLVAAQLGHASTAITEGGAYIDTQRAGAAKRRTALRVLAGGLR